MKENFNMHQEVKYDDVLLNILQEEGKVNLFLDVIFGFLRRRTDFYIVKENPSLKIGFPPCVAEQIVRDTFRKWEHPHFAYSNNIPSGEDDLRDLVVHEEEIVCTEEVFKDCLQTNGLNKEEDSSIEEPQSIQTHKTKTKPKNRDSDLSSDTYNGVDCGNYRWSQNNHEVDVKVPVPSDIDSRFNVNVNVEAKRLSVSVYNRLEGKWNTLLNGDLNYRHQVDESVWTLLPQSHISIHLEKAKEEWWDCLLTSEAKLDLNKLDISTHAHDLADEDHMQVERAIMLDESRIKGLPHLNYQEQLEKLKQAWDVEGSPFKGIPFDPSVLQQRPY